MVLLYTVEHRSRLSLLCFALACSVAALSDFLAGRWLFGIVALGFSVVALRRWNLRRRQNNHVSSGGNSGLKA
jgi:hypothetical protein